MLLRMYVFCCFVFISLFSFSLSLYPLVFLLRIFICGVFVFQHKLYASSLFHCILCEPGSSILLLTTNSDNCITKCSSCATYSTCACLHLYLCVQIAFLCALVKGPNIDGCKSTLQNRKKRNTNTLWKKMKGIK